jgi:hypothetical protein
MDYVSAQQINLFPSATNEALCVARNHGWLPAGWRSPKGCAANLERNNEADKQCFNRGFGAR